MKWLPTYEIRWIRLGEIGWARFHEIAWIPTFEIGWIPLDEILQLMKREVVTIGPEATVAQAAAVMRSSHVGTVIVTEERHGIRKPLGLITDRDIVVSVVALGVRPDKILVGEMMAKPLVTVHESEGIMDVVRIMQEKGVRRLPVVNSEAKLLGIISADDLWSHLGNEITSLSKLPRKQMRREETKRPDLS